MFETITLRTSVEEWSKDLDLAMSHMGIYRMDELKKGILQGINSLCFLLNTYDGVQAFRLDEPAQEKGYWAGIKINVEKSAQTFFAYIKYDVNEKGQLFGEIYYTHQAHTLEIPIPKGVEWRKDLMYDPEISNPAYCIANLKNHFIRFESFQQLGRNITYCVLME
jgi:hypothetical protein